MQTDPIGYEDQMNLYAYVRNDPMNFTDPTGMQTFYGCTSTGAASYSCNGNIGSNGNVMDNPKSGSAPQMGSGKKSDVAYETSFGDGKDDSDLKFTYGLQAGARLGFTKILGLKADLDIASKEISLVTGKEYANQSFALHVDVAGFSLGFDASRNAEFTNFVYGKDSVLGVLSGQPFEFQPVFSTPWSVSAKEFWKLDIGASAVFGIEGTLDFAQ